MTASLRNLFAAGKASVAKHSQHIWNAGSIIVTRIAVSILYFVAIPPFIAAHGPSGYGVVAFFATIVGYTVLLENGLSYPVTLRYTRALARGERSDEIIQAAVPLFAALAIGTACLLYSLADVLSEVAWGKNAYAEAIRILGVAVSLLILDALPVSIIQSHNKLVPLNLIRLSVDSLRVLALFTAIFSHEPLITVAWFFLASAGVKLICDVVYCVRTLANCALLRPTLSWKELVENMRFSPAMIVMSLIALAIATYDKLLASSYVGESQYAYYALAYDLCTKAHVLFFAFSATAYNNLIRHYATSRHARGFTFAFGGALLAMVLLYYLPLAAWAHLGIAYFLGDAFADNTMPLIQVLAVSSILYLAFTSFEAHLKAMGRLSALLVAYVLGFGVLLITAPRLVETHSLVGVCYALAATFAAMLAAVLCFTFLSRLIAKPKG